MHLFAEYRSWCLIVITLKIVLIWVAPLVLPRSFYPARFFKLVGLGIFSFSPAWRYLPCSRIFIRYYPLIHLLFVHLPLLQSCWSILTFSLCLIDIPLVALHFLFATPFKFDTCSGKFPQLCRFPLPICIGGVFCRYSTRPGASTTSAFFWFVFRLHRVEVHLFAPEDAYTTFLLSELVTFHCWSVSRSSINHWLETKALLELYRHYKWVGPDLVYHFTIKACLYGTLAARAGGVLLWLL